MQSDENKSDSELELISDDTDEEQRHVDGFFAEAARQRELGNDPFARRGQAISAATDDASHPEPVHICPFKFAEIHQRLHGEKSAMNHNKVNLQWTTSTQKAPPAPYLPPGQKPPPKDYVPTQTALWHANSAPRQPAREHIEITAHQMANPDMPWPPNKRLLNAPSKQPPKDITTRTNNLSMQAKSRSAVTAGPDVVMIDLREDHAQPEEEDILLEQALEQARAQAQAQPSGSADGQNVPKVSRDPRQVLFIDPPRRRRMYSINTPDTPHRRRREELPTRRVTSE